MQKPTIQELAAFLRVFNYVVETEKFDALAPASILVNLVRESLEDAKNEEVGNYLAAVQEADEKDMPRKNLIRPNYEGTQDYEFTKVQNESIEANRE